MFSKYQINIYQIIFGLIVLTIGALVYIIDRQNIYFVKYFNISFYGKISNIFGNFGNSFPDFIHPFAFIIITAGLFSLNKRKLLFISILWLSFDVLMELGQKYNNIALLFIPDFFDNIPFLENSKNYFIHGTYDEIDIFAIFLGAGSAYIMSYNFNKSSNI